MNLKEFLQEFVLDDVREEAETKLMEIIAEARLGRL